VDYCHNLCILNNNKDSKSDSSSNDSSNPGHNHYHYQLNHHDYKYQQQQLYSIIRKYISQGYLVIYAAECNTSIQSTVENMVQNGINAANLIKESSLIITNSNTIYSIDKAINAKMILQSLKSFVFDFLRKNDNNISLTKGKKIVTIATPEGFFERGKYSLYLDYEKLLAGGGDDDNNNTVVDGEFNNDILLEGICCYDTKLIEKLSFSDLISLFNAHSYTIHSGGIYREWDQEKILEVIHRAVIKVMGEVSEKIMFKVLEIVFNTNDDYIILKPDLFESRVRTMIGQKAADIVFSSVSREFMKQVTFSHDAE
jgi:hypothetical protein